MTCLPKSCVPFKSAQKQMQEKFNCQHPYHDGNLLFCHDMSDLEKKRMRTFGDRRLRKNFGVGQVSIMTSADKVSTVNSIKIPYRGQIFGSSNFHKTLDLIFNGHAFV